MSRTKKKAAKMPSIAQLKKRVEYFDQVMALSQPPKPKPWYSFLDWRHYTLVAILVLIFFIVIILLIVSSGSESNDIKSVDTDVAHTQTAAEGTASPLFSALNTAVTLPIASPFWFMFFSLPIVWIIVRGFNRF